MSDYLIPILAWISVFVIGACLLAAILFIGGLAAVILYLFFIVLVSVFS